MSDKEKKNRLAGLCQPESIKVIGESIGINALSEDVQQYLADALTYRLKELVQESRKFMIHGKRKRMTTVDLDHAVKLRGFEPIYSIHAKDYIPFRHASGGGREIHFTEDKEVDLQDIVNSPLPKVPFDVGVRSHWLSIDGDQPAIPENPPPISKDLQKMEVLDTSLKAAINKPKSASDGKGRPKVKVPDKVRLKEMTMHELSIEQQHYYLEITDACVGSCEIRRVEALHSLAVDPGLYQMLPRLTNFISEGVRINILQNNLALLIYLMRMTKSLMENTNLYLEKFVHDLIPALMSCIVSKQLCLRPDTDNHWALRDFAARLVCQLCKSFSTNTNNIQARITKMLSGVLLNDTAPLSTHYGAIIGLGEFGFDVIKAFVLPCVKGEADRLACILDNSIGNNIGLVSNTDRTAAEHVKQAFLKHIPPVLKMTRSPPDNMDEYRSDFGYLGAPLHSAVTKLRQVPAVTSIASALMPQKPLMQAAQPRAQFAPNILHGSMTPQLRTINPRMPLAGLASPAVSTQQKLVLVAQPRSNVPVFQSVQSSINQPGTTFIRVATSNTPGAATVVGAQAPKIVMLPSTPCGQTKSTPDLGMKSVFGMPASAVASQPSYTVADSSATNNSDLSNSFV